MDDVVRGLLVLWAASVGTIMLVLAGFAARRRDYTTLGGWMVAGGVVLAVAYRSALAL